MQMERVPSWQWKLRRDSRNRDRSAKHTQLVSLNYDFPRRHEFAIKIQINNAGPKPRFRLRFKTADRANLDNVEEFSLDWFKLVNLHPPVEICCIQGGSGGMDLNEDECFPLPPAHKRVYHGTYLNRLEGILS